MYSLYECPFCGEGAEYVTEDFGVVRVRCTECGLSTGVQSSKNLAGMIWNKLPRQEFENKRRPANCFVIPPADIQSPGSGGLT